LEKNIFYRLRSNFAFIGATPGSSPGSRPGSITPGSITPGSIGLLKRKKIYFVFREVFDRFLNNFPLADSTPGSNPGSRPGSITPGGVGLLKKGIHGTICIQKKGIKLTVFGAI
jgi:hypothetical protein